MSYLPSEVLISSPFNHIETLSLECTTDSINQLEKIVNLSSIKHLKLLTAKCTPFTDLLQAAPNISQLSMDRNRLIQIIDSLPDDQNVYEQIKTLNMKDAVLSTDIDQISRIFSKLEHVSLSVKHRDNILFIFNGFKHLISATVSWAMPFKTHLPLIDECLQQNNICTDSTYYFHGCLLHAWID